MARHHGWFAVLPLLMAALAVPVVAVTAAAPGGPLTLRWEKNFLRVRGDAVPGREIEIHYLEAYCRPGSTDRDWRETVIGHETEKVSAREDGSGLASMTTAGEGRDIGGASLRLASVLSAEC